MQVYFTANVEENRNSSWCVLNKRWFPGKPGSRIKDQASRIEDRGSRIE